MTCMGNILFWQEFIEIYKSLPQLWKIKDDTYYNKQLKLKGYNILKEKLREKEKDATVDSVKKRINNLRGCYRRELKKLRQSERVASSPDEIYKPTLWYFDKLKFLEHQLDDVASEDVECDPIGCSPQPKKPKRTLEVQRTELQMMPISSLQVQKKDDSQILSDYWRLLYNKLDSRQQIFANKTIVEVLYQGALGNLNEHSWRAFDKEFQPPPLLSPQAVFISSSPQYSAQQADSFTDENLCISSSPQHIFNDDQKPSVNHNSMNKSSATVGKQVKNNRTALWAGDDTLDESLESNLYDDESEGMEMATNLNHSEDEYSDFTETKPNLTTQKWNQAEETQTQRKTKLRQRK